MQRALTSAQMKAAEGAAAAEHGQTAEMLMERAGVALAEAAWSQLGTGGRFFVFCGPGNNGGDGLVAARQLVSKGHEVRVFFVPQRPAAGTLAKTQEERLSSVLTRGVGETLPEHDAAGNGDVVIDALLGTGLNRAPEGAFADAIARIATLRARGAKVIAADLPSGLNADTGTRFEPSVEADVTVSFGYPKLGNVLEPGASACGVLRVADIGIPADVWNSPSLGRANIEAPWLVDESQARSALPKRSSDSNKGTYGHVLVVGGSPGKTGAAAMTGIAALRSGAGLVTVAASERALDGILRHAPELMGLALPDGPLGAKAFDRIREALPGKSAVVVGPGIARGAETREFLAGLLEHVPVPLVLDADALNVLAEAEQLELLMRRGSGAPVILTPHPGEMSRLAKRPTSEIQANRIAVLREFAARYPATWVLKGARTLVGHGERCWINPTGNPGMSTGGTGDVLAGMVGALCAQGLDTESAAVTAVYVHGWAGDLAAAVHGQMGLMATDLFAGLGEVWRRWGR